MNGKACVHRKYRTNNLNILEIVNAIKMKLFFSFYMSVVFWGEGGEDTAKRVLSVKMNGVS